MTRKSRNRIGTTNVHRAGICMSVGERECSARKLARCTMAPVCTCLHLPVPVRWHLCCCFDRVEVCEDPLGARIEPTVSGRPRCVNACCNFHSSDVCPANDPTLADKSLFACERCAVNTFPCKRRLQRRCRSAATREREGGSNDFFSETVERAEKRRERVCV